MKPRAGTKPKFGKIPLEMFREDRGTELVSPAAVLGLYGSIPDFYRKACHHLARQGKVIHSERYGVVSRANQIWKAIASLFCFCAPCLLDGKCQHKSHMNTVLGLQTLFRWSVNTVAFGGFDKYLSYMKTITDWGEYYSLFPVNRDLPPCPRGILGGRGDWLTFPWAKGHLGVICPTVGPHKGNLVHDHEWYSSALFHLHLAKRGFGAPGREQEIKSYQKHKAFLQEPVIVPQVVVDSAYQFSFNYFRQRVGLRVNPQISESASACHEYSRGKGGRSRFVKECVQSFLSEEPSLELSVRDLPPILYTVWGDPIEFSQYHDIIEVFEDNNCLPYSLLFSRSSLPPDPGPLGSVDPGLPIRVVDYNWITQLVLFQYLVDTGDLELPFINPPDFQSKHGIFFSLWKEDPQLNPDHMNFSLPIYKATSVPDPGCKARIITVGSGAWVTLGHLFRTVVYDCFKSDNETILEESSQLGGAFPEWFARVNKSPAISDDDYYLSVDLTSATDTFSGEVCQALALGAADAVRPVSEPVWRRLRLLARRNVAAIAKIIYPELNNDYVIQRRGVLMGNAESWGILNIYNKFFTRAGEYAYTLGIKHRITSWSDPIIPEVFSQLADKPVCITKRCGDDQVMKGPRLALDHYLELITLSGAIPSPGSNCISKKVITFIQSLALERDGKVDWIDIVRLISLVDWMGINRLPSIKETPRIWFRGLSYYLALRWWNVSPWELSVRKGLLVFGQYLCHDFIKSASSLGLEPFLLSGLGGLGFPHPTGRDLPHVRPRVRRAIGYILRDDQTPDVFLQRVQLDIWNLHSGASPSSKWGRKIAEDIFLYYICDYTRGNLENYDSSDLSWVDLNQIRTHMKISMPLSEINLKVIRATIEELKLVSIGTFWKTITGCVRQYLSNLFPPESIQNPEQRFSKKAEVFRERIRSLEKSPGFFSDAYHPKIIGAWENTYLEARIQWADHYILVTRALNDGISKILDGYMDMLLFDRKFKEEMERANAQDNFSRHRKVGSKNSVGKTA